MSVPPDILTVTNDTLAKAERILGAARWLLCLVAASVLWVARVEWGHADQEKRLGGLEGDVKTHGATLERMKGHFGLTDVSQPDPPAVVLSREDRGSQ